MDVTNIINKLHILGGHCEECDGFLFAEIKNNSPLVITERCLKCGKEKNITDSIVNIKETIEIFNCNESEPKIYINNKDDKEWYREIIAGGINNEV